jgi:hypothetical protein
MIEYICDCCSKKQKEELCVCVIGAAESAV